MKAALKPSIGNFPPSNPSTCQAAIMPAAAATLNATFSCLQASSLAELFLKPGQPIFTTDPPTGEIQQPQLAAGYDSDDGDMHEASFDASGGDGEDAADGGWADLDFGESSDLIEAPRKVAQIGISYARASKQVSLQPWSQAREGMHALFLDTVESTALDLDNCDSAPRLTILHCRVWIHSADGNLVNY